MELRVDLTGGHEGARGSDLEFESRLLESTKTNSESGSSSNTPELGYVLNALESNSGSAAPSAVDQRSTAYNDERQGDHRRDL